MLRSVSKLFIFYIFLFGWITLINAQNSDSIEQTITGSVNHDGSPLQNVHISILGSNTIEKSAKDGSYTIKARPGDKLRFSHVGFKAITIIIEDITRVLHIEMFAENNLLQEALVRTKRETSALRVARKKAKTFMGAYGPINPSASGFAVDYVDGETLSPAAPNIAMALNGKAPGIMASLNSISVRGRPVIWDVDGVLETDIPLINQVLVKDIYIFRNPPVRYGTNLAVIVIRTINAPEVLQDKREAIAEQYRNQNFYNNDADSLNNEYVVSASFSKDRKQQIRGSISYDNQPIENVHIQVKESSQTTVSDSNGDYIIQADPGQTLVFSHLSFKKISILLEDTSDILNIEMSPKTEILEESIVKASRKKGQVLERALKSEKEFSTSRGQINPKTAGYAVGFVDGSEINNAYPNILLALEGKISNFSYDRVSGQGYLRGRDMSILNSYPAAWEVDGIFTKEPPISLDLSEIESVYALKSVAATNKYGQDGAGGVIVIKTKFRNYASQKKRNDLAARATNQNFYFDDAVAFSEEQLNSNAYLQELVGINDKYEALSYYNKVLKKQLINYGQHLSVAQKFRSHFKDAKIAQSILLHLANDHQKNAEILKAIAYQHQTSKEKKRAIKLYEDVIRLRPKYAQSYRDLANAYLENEQFQKAWRLYMNYIFRGNDVSGEGIGQIMYNEMEWLYFVRNNQTKIRERFSPKNKSIDDFRNDIRIVVEWNTSEAEFDLEFVNPEKRAYVFEHSLEKNEALIIDEKTRGYTSKEFFIEDIGQGEWLMNLSYFGNKKPAPTYFKVSIFSNWGRHNQTQKISNFKFEQQRKKIQLLKINRQSL